MDAINTLRHESRKTGIKIGLIIGALATVMGMNLAVECKAAPPEIRSPSGKYLGTASSNRFDPESVSNPLGKYGSPLERDSINNPLGRYGSPTGEDSVNNPFARSGGSRGRHNYDDDDE